MKIVVGTRRAARGHDWDAGPPQRGVVWEVGKLQIDDAGYDYVTYSPSVGRIFYVKFYPPRAFNMQCHC